MGEDALGECDAWHGTWLGPSIGEQRADLVGALHRFEAGAVLVAPGGARHNSRATRDSVPLARRAYDCYAAKETGTGLEVTHTRGTVRTRSAWVPNPPGRRS